MPRKRRSGGVSQASKAAFIRQGGRGGQESGLCRHAGMWSERSGACIGLVWGFDC